MSSGQSHKEEDADTCPICFERWSNGAGEPHRLCALLCGHVFGYSCIIKWMDMKDNTCPICKKSSNKEDIRIIYARKLVALDNETDKRNRTCITNYTWVHNNITQPIPNNALKGGIDSDGSPIYIGRTYFENDLLPTKIVPFQNAAYVSYNCKEHCIKEYEVLCGDAFKWVPSTHGNVPVGAFPAGKCCNGEKLYIGRVNHLGSMQVGKIHPSHKCLYIGYDGKEICYRNNYEILIALFSLDD